MMLGYGVLLHKTRMSLLGIESVGRTIKNGVGFSTFFRRYQWQEINLEHLMFFFNAYRVLFLLVLLFFLLLLVCKFVREVQYKRLFFGAVHQIVRLV